jgi:hypothetical protein
VSRNSSDSSDSGSSVDGELERRHRAAVLTIYAMLALTVLLAALSLAGVLSEAAGFDPLIDGALRIAVVFFGLGAVAVRRAMFSGTRLQAIASLRGPSGLLAHLQKTTMIVAALGGAIALMGFVLTLIRDAADETPAMLWIGLIAVAVLLYAFPRRTAWRRVLELARKGEVADESSAKGTLA